MTKYLKVSVKSPCQENWDSMTQVEQHKFCNNCAKTVVDCSQFSNKELTDFVLQNQPGFCGRFTPDQLKRKYFVDSPKPSWLTMYIVASAVLFLGISYPIQSAAQKTTKPKSRYSYMIDQSELAELNKVHKDSTITIRGKVTEAETEEAIIGATVIVKDTYWAVSTNLDGEFELSVPKSLLANPIEIKTSFIGCFDKQVIVSKETVSSIQDIRLENNPDFTFSCHVIGRTSISTSGFISDRVWRFKHWLKSLRK